MRRKPRVGGGGGGGERKEKEERNRAVEMWRWMQNVGPYL